MNQKQEAAQFLNKILAESKLTWNEHQMCSQAVKILLQEPKVEPKVETVKE